MSGDTELTIDSWILKLENYRNAVIDRTASDKELADGYFKIVPSAGGHNKELFDKDLLEYTLKHKYLMNEVNSIHESEHDNLNKTLTSTKNSFHDVLMDGVNGKSGNKIYVLNDKNIEYIFVGDIHSDIDGFDRMLIRTEFFKEYLDGKKKCYVFTGDYVDRGKSHLDILGRIMTLKYAFRDRVILLRGNHDGGKRNDDGSIKLPYRVFPEEDITLYFPLYSDELAKKNQTYEAGMTELYFEFFNKLSYIALISSNDKCVMAVHGGVPRPTLEYGNPESSEDNENNYEIDDKELFAYLDKVSDLTNGDIKDFLGRSVIESIMWSDPIYGDEDDRKNMGRFKFYEKHFDAFSKKYGADHIIRGHQYRPEGIYKTFGDKVYTVFSSGHLIGENNLTTAYEGVKAKVLSLKEGEFKEIEI